MCFTNSIYIFWVFGSLSLTGSFQNSLKTRIKLHKIVYTVTKNCLRGWQRGRRENRGIAPRLLRGIDAPVKLWTVAASKQTASGRSLTRASSETSFTSSVVRRNSSPTLPSRWWFVVATSSTSWTSSYRACSRLPCFSPSSTASRRRRSISASPRCCPGGCSFSTLPSLFHARLTTSRFSVCYIVREYVFYVFWKLKNATFLRFFEVTLKNPLKT